MGPYKIMQEITGLKGAKPDQWDQMEPNGAIREWSMMDYRGLNGTISDKM